MSSLPKPITNSPHQLLHRHHPSASFAPPSGLTFPTYAHLERIEGANDRIKKLFNSKINLSVSSYDTAWVAMLPSPNHSHTPCFPQCLHWLLNNQLRDGSWGPLQPHSNLHRHPLLLKDALSSTLASILALKRWGVGQLQIGNGLQFIESNFSSLTDNDQHSPIGFDIIFPGMIEYANSLDIRLPIELTLSNGMLRKRESEITRCYESHSPESKSYLAYVSEGLGNLYDWEMVMKYQLKNGSLFNSPSTTAAALAHHHDPGCLDYLISLLDKFGDAVPTVHPLNLYVRLCMIDNLERLGIDRHFQVEIQSILDETYRCWQQEDEQILMDVATCAIAFRLLRMNGYDVSADRLSEVANKGNCFSSPDGHSKDLSAALEVYRASQLIIFKDESVLGEHNSRSSSFLKQKLSDTSFPSDALTKHTIQEVNDALIPFGSASKCMINRRYIEQYSVDSSITLKTAYWSLNIKNRDFLNLAVEDYNTCQSIYTAELEYLERWVVENKLNELKFARQKTAYCYFTTMDTFSSPKLSDARLSCAKCSILATVVDDFFDVVGSVEKQLNLIHLVERWNVDIDQECCSEDVRIIFLALKRAICEIAEDGLKWQARSVKSHIIEIWLNLLKSMQKESVWAKEGGVPKLEEYITNGHVSIALGTIVLPALYLVGPKLSEEMVQSEEYDNLFKLMGTHGRLVNDTQTFKREYEEGKLNAVTLQIIHSNGEAGEEKATREMKIYADNQKRELLRLILENEDSVIPRVCKDVFWNMTQHLSFVYRNGDGFTSNDLLSTIKSIICDPISIKLDSA